MNTLDLKKNFHLLIDSIENEDLLATYYDLIKKRSSTNEGQLWNRLTYEEQEELISALGESESPEYLISTIWNQLRKLYKFIGELTFN